MREKSAKQTSNYVSFPRNCIKKAMKGREVSYYALQKRLERRGLHYSTENLKNRINRGCFPADFMLECLSAIGETSVIWNIEEDRIKRELGLP
ncbi:DUF6471 domain-containing protein [Sphingorhabdus sp.]|jgi:hypothetical protein|uniref:DUF6471 domain-containing protein n=2 Tax=Sphingorhabdus sp. TaxID=1902408 RepID=UPI003BB0A6B8